MVFFAPFVGAALLCASLATAVPLPSMATTTSMSMPTSMPYMKESSSSKMMDKSSSKMMEKSSMKKDMTTSMKMSESKTSTSMMTYSTPSYGSGMNKWGGNGYNDCVAQCIADNGGMKMGEYKMPKASKTASMGTKGTGATHTVIVAPSQGVLRYVPMAVNASVGDTIFFMWGANNHTVTKGSALEPCNKTKDALFTSGSHDKGFTFTQVVNDTKPTFFFCNTPGHCQKGMFGIINPPSNAGAPSSCKNSWDSMMKNSSILSSMNQYMNMMKSKTDTAMNWGNNIDMNSVPEIQRDSLAQNIAFTRTFLAANPDVFDSEGKVDIGRNQGAPFVIPKDLGNTPPATFNVLDDATNAVTSAINSVATAAAAAITSSSSSSAPSATASKAASNGKTGGAVSIRSSAGLASVAVVVAALVAL